MDATQRLFERFEKTGPSWLPIIILSSIGLLATIVSVRSATGLADAELSATVERVYQLSRESGQLSTLLYQISLPADDFLSDQDRKNFTAIKTMFSRLTFLGVLNAAPAFQPESDDGSNLGRDSTGADARRMYCWSNGDGKLILIAQFDSTRDDLQLGSALVISRHSPAESESSLGTFLSTFANPGETPLGNNERALDLDLTNADAVTTLLKTHRDRLQDKTLESFDATNLDLIVQSFFDQRAFAFVNRGGFTYEERLTQLQQLSGEQTDYFERRLVAAMQAGHRNGVSKQFDELVLEKRSRQNENPAGPNSRSSVLIMHPLSCPIRTESMLQVIDGQSFKQFTSDHGYSSSSVLDFPSNLAQQIELIAQDSLSLQQRLQSLNDQIKGRPDLKEVFHIDDPFPATVYQPTQTQ